MFRVQPRRPAELLQRCDPEIEDLGLARRIHEDVFRLQVAMNHAMMMGELDGVANPHQQRQSLQRVEALCVGILHKRLAVNIFHHEIRTSVFDGMVRRPAHDNFAAMKESNDPAMSQPSEELLFLFESKKTLSHESPSEDLDRNVQGSRRVGASVHNSHTAAADDVDDPIGRDGKGDFPFILVPVFRRPVGRRPAGGS